VRGSLLLEGMMSMLRKKLLFVATAFVTVLAFIQSPSAQSSGTAGMGKDVSASAAAADKKAADAMLNQPSSTPTDVDRKAAAAMQSKPAQTK
jgi:hypothetical protein